MTIGIEEEAIYSKNRKEWRRWLEKNHDKKKKIALVVYKKHTGKPSLTHREAIEEAICFGWIDTTIKKIDDDIFLRRFTRRTDKSKWSDNTLGYAKQLIKEGKMSPAGLKRYEEGLKRPVHDKDVPKNPGVPKDLKKALEKNKKAKENFYKFAPSYRRVYLRWLASAKLPETRKKRIKKVIDNSRNNLKR